jgi:allene oxide cyclase-like protein
MRKKLSLGAVLLLLLTLAVVVVASASGDDGKDEFKLVATRVQESEIDLPPEGEFSQGDQVVFTEDLFQDGKQVGKNGGVCSLVRLGPGESATFHCVATLSLEKGQLTIQGLVTFAGETDTAPFVLAITGGTGAFARAHGELTVKEVSETEIHYTVALK